MMWPFRTPSPRDVYPEDEPIPVEPPKPDPDAPVTIKRYDIGGGVLEKRKVHVCTPPSAKELKVQDRYAELEAGDQWTCKTCAKSRWWNGALWSAFKPE